MVSIERDIERAILAQKRWADLDNRMRGLIGSTEEYDDKIKRYSIENQLRYRGNLVRFVINNEDEYYRKLLKHSRDHLMLFPYHLSDYIITGMRITPFQYYLSVMHQIIEDEKSYDTLPNFTAADCLRLLGIGRNQYIDIMNELRSTYRTFWLLNLKKNASSLLPNKPNANVPIEPWWYVAAGYITEDDVKSMVTPAEKLIIDMLVSRDQADKLLDNPFRDKYRPQFNQIMACYLDEAHVRSLYVKGLIYLDVPVHQDDHIVIPPLQGFVMNRVTGDYFETLLYKIFVSIDQNTKVSELANILDIDINLVENAISMFCRLEFAHKKRVVIDMVKCHPSWLIKIDECKKRGIDFVQEFPKHSINVSHFMNELASVEHIDNGLEISDDPSSSKSSYNLSIITQQSPNTTSKMVTSSTIVDHLSSQLDSLSPTTSSISKKIALFYDSNLTGFLMMKNLGTKLNNHAVTMYEVGKLSDEWIDSLLVELAQIKCDKLDDGGYEARRYYIHAIMLHRTIEFIKTDLKLASSVNSTSKETDADLSSQRIGLDLVRIESLSNLDSESCGRFLKKNYKLIISIAPLNHDITLNATSDIPHIGPGSTLLNSIWLRLYLYHVTGHGPASMLLVQGYRLTELPEAITKYGYVLIHRDMIQRDPTCVATRNAVNIINDALTQSPVLVQAYPIPPVCGNLINGEEKLFVPFPFDESKPIDTQSKGSPFDLNHCAAIVALRNSVDLSRLCGYVTLLKTGKWIDKLLDDEQNQCLFGSSRRRSNTKISQDESQNKSNQANTGENNESTEKEKDDQDEALSMNDLLLYDCNFGVPLFDRLLNKQVRLRITSKCLSDQDSPKLLVETTKSLNKTVNEFVETFCKIDQLSSMEAMNSGDQRHYFKLPKSEQFQSAIPRPTKNLIFKDGKLSVINED